MNVSNELPREVEQLQQPTSSSHEPMRCSCSLVCNLRKFICCCNCPCNVDHDGTNQQNSDSIAEISADFHSILTRERKLLRRCFVVSPGLLFELKSVDFIRDKLSHRRATTDTTTDELLNILVDVPDCQQQSMFSCLLSALREDGQEHVANIFHPESDAQPMSAKQYQLLQDKREELIQFIDPTYALMRKLVRDGVLSECENDKIMNKSNYSEMTIQLVNIVQCKPNRSFTRFIEALRLTGQQHVVDIMTGESDEPTNWSHDRRQVLFKARENLVRKVELTHSALLSNGVLNEVDMLQVEAKLTREDKAGVLIDALARKSHSAFEKFVKTWKHNIGHIEIKGQLDAYFKHNTESEEKHRILKVVGENMNVFAFSGRGEHVSHLTRLLEGNGFAVSQISEGNIRISFRCFTEESLVNLKRLYAHKTLDKLFTKVCCPSFAKRGLKSLKLRIAENEFVNINFFSRAETEMSFQANSFSDQPMELLELVLLRTSILLFADYYKSLYKTHEAIRLAYCTLTAVCYNWWQTINGWPQSTTKHWSRHKLRRAVNHVCRPYAASPRQQSTLTETADVFGVTVCDNKLFVACKNSIRAYGPNNKEVAYIQLEQLGYPRDIVSCTDTQQLYVVGRPSEYYLRGTTRVWRVSMDRLKVVEWLPNNSSPFVVWTLSVTSRRLLVTSQHSNDLRLYGADGVELKRVPLPDLKCLQHAVETSRGTFIVGHRNPQPRVCEVDVDGHVTRVYCDQQKLSWPIYLSLDSVGRIFVADCHKHRVLLLNSEKLELERVLLDTQQHQLTTGPYRLCYTEQTRQLAVGGNEYLASTCSYYPRCVQLFTVR